MAVIITCYGELPIAVRFQIVPDAGHSANERGTAEELVAAMEWFKAL